MVCMCGGVGVGVGNTGSYRNNLRGKGVTKVNIVCIDVGALWALVCEILMQCRSDHMI